MFFSLMGMICIKENRIELVLSSFKLEYRCHVTKQNKFILIFYVCNFQPVAKKAIRKKISFKDMAIKFSTRGRYLRKQSILRIF